MNIFTSHEKLTFKEISSLMKNAPSGRTIRNDLA
jgi:hypothetical protein